jgi:serine/threonine-protein kinase
MGEVYRARDTRLDRDVAVKVLPEGLARDASSLSRFEREAKALAALSHPNILTILDFGLQDGVTYAVMELLEGETLRSYREARAMPWREAAEIGVAIADGLAAAHSKGIIHRDLKPENVFLTSGGRVKILDFGLARREKLTSPDKTTAPTVTQETLPGTVMGTVGYMSPEQVSGQPGDARSDIFSFGCVLYEMATGERAFSGRTGAETMAAILKEDPPDPMKSGKELPSDLVRVTLHCLAKKPEQRFQSAQDLAFDLKAILAGTAVSAPALVPGARRSPRKLRLIAPGIGLLVVLVGIGFAVFRGSPFPAGGRSANRSLAVLPLENLSGDPEQEYFADGMTEELITQLAQIGALRVISPASVMKYKRAARTIREIGSDLKSDLIVTGSILRSGGRVRITAKLTEAATDSILWAERYERDVGDVLAIQNEVARTVVERIKVKTTVREQARLAKAKTVDPRVYEAYLKGRFYWNKRTPEDLVKGLDYFREAIEKDPTYAPAYAGLADSYILLGFYGMLLPGDAFPRAKQAAAKALQLDSELAEAHASLARVTSDYEWQWPSAEREYKRAIELNPSYAVVHQHYGIALIARGRAEEGIVEVKRSLELDPFSMIANLAMGWAHYLTGHYDSAIEQHKRTIELFPASFLAQENLADTYEAKGSHEEAFAAYQRWATAAGMSAETIAALGQAYRSGGMKGYWRKRLEMEKQEAEEGNVWFFRLATLHARVGEREQALSWLEKACAEHYDRMIFLKVDPAFDGLRRDPRFSDLLRRVGLSG